MAVYRLDFLKPNGEKYAQVADVRWLSLKMGVHQVGVMRGELNGNLAMLSDLAHLDLVELWKADPDAGQDWARFFSGEFISPKWMQPTTRSFQFSVAGDLRKLRSREILWRAGSTNRTKFISAAGETIMKTLATYNCTSQAIISNGRLVDGTIAGVSVEADLGRGNVTNWYCFADNLLESLTALARIAGGDFNLVKTAEAAWEFRYYPGQLGTDRRAEVLFAMERNNMAEPEYEVERWDEATVAVAGGRGDDADREFRSRTGANYSAANHVESFVNATSVEKGDLNGLDAMADKELGARQARESFSFRVVQTASCRFAVHYGIGDLVTVRNPFTAADSVQKVKTLYLGLKNSGEESETIDIEVATP